MDFTLPENEEEEDEEDVDLQYMIEQSLLECGQPGDYSESAPVEERRVPETSPENQKVFAAIKSEADGDGWIPLHAAAVQINKTILEITFAASTQGAGHSHTIQGKTPLFLAVEKGLRANATFLLQNGSNPDSRDEEEDSPLVAAIKNNQYDMASLLIRFNANVNQEGAHRRKPLHEAAHLGATNFVDLLLQSGADTDPRSEYGLTPLALAAQYGHYEIVQTLVQKGADVDSQAMDSATILFEAAASGNPDIISLLLEYGADANVPKHTGHLPIHRVAHRGHLLALERLMPVTSREAVKESGMSPLHSAAAGGHPQCLEILLKAGYDVNFMLHPRVRRNYDDERRSALFFAVSNDDLRSTRLLLEAGAMPNQDPVKCLQVALRLGNYELINLLLRYGANVNYYSRINAMHFPSALQYALKDEVLLRMLLNYGYDAQRCFDCPYGQDSHVPHDYEGWTPTVIKDTMFCEVITVYWLRDISGFVVRILLDYVDHVQFCSKLKAALMEQKQWPDICRIQENTRCLKHLCRLKIRDCLGKLRLRAPIFMNFLPLPKSLKDYVRYQEYDLYGLGTLKDLR
ncbi:dynein axonemal heavy chain 12 isoform X2 [Paramormyrops kingsleyae]|uniref:dynein axonemal heavy chain 12 isoform X2 n=1 Tax=Paramormyrops kingsleyae TaxID=1676925 RepID=UPI000CD62AAA|nr:ankyrin repeat and SOCS box protein 14 isoform X2 [Paramormyrops kingsleyae]